MTTRIRYTKLENGNLELTQPIVAGTDLLSLTLIPSELRFVITDSQNGGVVETGEAVSLQMLKLKAKRTLMSRGVVFSEEVRSRKQM